MPIKCTNAVSSANYSCKWVCGLVFAEFGFIKWSEKGLPPVVTLTFELIIGVRSGAIGTASKMPRQHDRMHERPILLLDDAARRKGRPCCVR